MKIDYIRERIRKIRWLRKRTSTEKILFQYLRERTCEWCGKEFIPKARLKRNTYCSKKCLQLADDSARLLRDREKEDRKVKEKCERCGLWSGSIHKIPRNSKFETRFVKNGLCNICREAERRKK